MALVAELEKIRREMEANDTWARALVDGVNEDQLVQRPEPQRWSIAENLVHLQITTKTFLPGVDRALQQARERNFAGRGPFPLGLMDRLFVWYVEPPPAIRLPAPKPLQPLAIGAPSGVLPRFLSSQQEMLTRVEASNGLDLRRARYVSPLASYIRMSLLGFFCVFTGHQRRHLWQASNVRVRIGLPLVNHPAA